MTKRTSLPPKLQPIVRYQLVEQYCDNNVKIRDLWLEREMVMPVNKLVIDENMMAQFRGNDACTLGYIFATQNDATTSA